MIRTSGTLAQIVAFFIDALSLAAHVLAANGNNIHLAGSESHLGNRADLVNLVN